MHVRRVDALSNQALKSLDVGPGPLESSTVPEFHHQKRKANRSHLRLMNCRDDIICGEGHGPRYGLYGKGLAERKVLRRRAAHTRFAPPAVGEW